MKAEVWSNDSALPLVFLLPAWDEGCNASLPSFLLLCRDVGFEGGLPSLFPLPRSRNPRCPPATCSTAFWHTVRQPNPTLWYLSSGLHDICGLTGWMKEL